jgi:hypothetical protein
MAKKFPALLESSPWFGLVWAQLLSIRMFHSCHLPAFIKDFSRLLEDTFRTLKGYRFVEDQLTRTIETDDLLLAQKYATEMVASEERLARLLKPVRDGAACKLLQSELLQDPNIMKLETSWSKTS